ncbi:hypothetical protein [Cohnella sp. GCM10012308]|uniref:hypothetical protein n=1 Tax=Cohnella sp. GCM10012308 TaxID=3317329 RepID=UPI0036227D55
MQVNSKRMPEMGLMAENNCLMASILHRRVDIGKKSCIFAGFKARGKMRRHQKRSCIFAGFAAKKRRWRGNVDLPDGRLSARPNANAASDRH